MHKSDRERHGLLGQWLRNDVDSRSSREACVASETKFGSDTMLNNIISNAMCYTMLYMLEWMWKGKYRIETSRTRGLRSSVLSAYLHRGIP